MQHFNVFDFVAEEKLIRISFCGSEYNCFPMAASITSNYNFYSSNKQAKKPIIALESIKEFYLF
jgi:hypothetical protein